MTQPETSPLGIIAGRGNLPIQLAEYCRETNRPCFIIGLEGETNMQPFVAFPQTVVKIGHIGKVIDALQDFGAETLVMAGPINRPKLRNIRTDKMGAKLLARLLKSRFRGDNSLLSSVIQWFEEQGLTVVGADDVMGTLLAPAGPLGIHAPDSEANTDITLGVDVLRALSPLDVGQSVIVRRGYVIGIEAAEGTEELIARCADYMQDDPGGVLVKLPKQGQETRADLPTIGPDTIDQLIKAGIRGVAVQAGGALLLEQDAMRRKANENDLFIVGISMDQNGS